MNLSEASIIFMQRNLLKIMIMNVSIIKTIENYIRIKCFLQLHEKLNWLKMVNI